LLKRVASVESTITTFTALQTVSANDSIGVQVVGSAIDLYHKPSAGSWTLIQSTTDSSIASAGYIGIGSGAGITVEPRADDFGGGTISSSLPSDTPFLPLGRGASW
jgi:hypothetical protein